MIDQKANKQLVKGLKEKQRKPGWWAKRSRKNLIKNILSELQAFDIKSAWAHKAFVSTQEKRQKNITIYVDFKGKKPEGFAHKVDMAMDKAFPKKKISIIDVKSLQPAIKEFVFKDVDQIL
jgi:hypothetical protein